MDYATDTSPIVLDIETAGLPNAADYLDPVTPDARLKDPDKIAADIEAKTAARLENLALDWNVGRIVAIGTWTAQHGTVAMVCPDEAAERAALTSFWISQKYRTMVGYHIKGFDLRYLVQRSRYLDVPHPSLNLGKYGRSEIVDLYLELTFGDGHYDTGAMKRSLGAFAKRFGLPVTDTIKGSEIPALVAAGEWAAVESHVRADVATTLALARRLGVVSAEATRG